jgi:glutaredoxin
MYTIDGCSACKNAKELCDKKGIKYKALPRAGNEELIKKLTNDYKYVPVIIDRNNKFIGGFQELQKLTS